MTHRWPAILAAVLLAGAPTPAAAQTASGPVLSDTGRQAGGVEGPVLSDTGRQAGGVEGPVLSDTGRQAGGVEGPYARIAVLHPRDGQTTDFEAGYLRHLAWHQQAGDRWVWYGWTVTFGERQRWFVYATFGHSIASLDKTLPAAEDERDNVLNVAPHVDSWGSALYEFRPPLSRGTGVPQPAARLELTTVDLHPGADAAFEKAVAAAQSALSGETLWYRLVAGGAVPRYVRLRPIPSLAAMIAGRREPTLPDAVHALIVKTTVEVLTLRPAMSLGVTPERE